jgi:AcrR family transcriptional regulator
MKSQSLIPQPQSRRERPAKPTLSREGIINAALTMLEREGLGKVTMRRIAIALDTGPASLYVYVRNTDDLHAQILDSLLAQMAPIPSHGSWRQRLHDQLAEYSRILFEYPEIARMTQTTHPTGPHYLSLVESILALLDEGGAPDDVAAWGIDLLLASVTATAVEHGTEKSENEYTDSLSDLAASIAIVPGETYPRIVRLGDEMLSGTGIERFHWGLDVLINGILGTPRAAASNAQK